jgi:hypothetical protein
MKKILALVAVATMLTGCATTKRMDFDDLNRWQIDCANRDVHIRFFESQRTNANDRLIAGLTLDKNRAQINDRSYDAVLVKLIWDYRTYCPDMVSPRRR